MATRIRRPFCILETRECFEVRTIERRKKKRNREPAHLIDWKAKLFTPIWSSYQRNLTNECYKLLEVTYIVHVLGISLVWCVIHELRFFFTFLRITDFIQFQLRTVHDIVRTSLWARVFIKVIIALRRNCVIFTWGFLISPHDNIKLQNYWSRGDLWPHAIDSGHF